MEAIKNRIIKSGTVNWKSFEFIQPDNFKDLSDEAYKKLKESITKNNFIESFKVWKDGKKLYCLDGYHRCKVLRNLENEGVEIPELLKADFIECSNKDEAAKLVLVYSSIYAKITNEGLLDLMNEYNLNIDDLGTFIDIPDINIDKIKQDIILAGQTKEDEFDPELPEKPKTKPGDIYELTSGKGMIHRIICGSSSDEEMYKKLFQDEQASMVFTSPPYNMSSNLYSNYKDNLEREEYINFILQVGSNIKSYLIPGGALFLNISYNKNAKSEYIDVVYKFMHELQFNLAETVVWYKKSGLPITNEKDLTRYFEYIYCFSNGNLEIRVEKNEYDLFAVLVDGYVEIVNKGSRKVKSNVWEIPVNAVQYEDLKACFPVKLPAEGIKLYSNPGNIIFEPFLGSGSTLMACEQLNRKCYAVELEPAYVDLSVKRLIKYVVGENQEYILKRNGKEFKF